MARASPARIGRARRRNSTWPPTGRAADFWTRYAEDFRLVRGLGLNSFRLGIEWSRVQPSLAPGESRPSALSISRRWSITRKC